MQVDDSQTVVEITADVAVVLIWPLKNQIPFGIDYAINILLACCFVFDLNHGIAIYKFLDFFILPKRNHKTTRGVDYRDPKVIPVSRFLGKVFGHDRDAFLKSGERLEQGIGNQFFGFQINEAIMIAGSTYHSLFFA